MKVHGPSLRSWRSGTAVLAAVVVGAALTLVSSPVVKAATVDPAAYYQIVSRSSGKALAVSAASTADNAGIVQQNRDAAATHQQFQFVDSGSGYYRLRARHSGKVVDVAARSTADGAEVVQWADNNATNQQFQLVDTDATYVRIRNRNSGKVLDVWEGSTADGARISQYTDSNATNQQWQLVRVGGSTGAPSIRLISPYTTPTEGWTVRGSIAFAVDATAADGISRVEFYVDGALASTDTAYPYGMLWNTYSLSRGAHTLRAVATSTGGGTAAVQQQVTVAAPYADRATSGSVVSAGLLPSIQPLIDNIRLRDVSLSRGHDGAYYLTGTGSDNDAWKHNEGINLWRSTNLRNWTYVGLVWSFERDGIPDERAWWDKSGAPFRAVWAPEFQYLNGNYYIVYSLATKGSKLLRSTTGRPEGPYANVRSDGGNLFGNIDGSLLQDTDGTGYLCYESGNIFRLNSAWTGTTGSVVRANSGGDEGCFLFRANGRYYLSAAKFMDNGRYSAWIGWSSSPTGPFTGWHEAIPTGGHNSFFQDCAGNWWGTYFGNDSQAVWWQRPGIVKIAFNADGTIRPNSNQSTPTC